MNCLPLLVRPDWELYTLWSVVETLTLRITGQNELDLAPILETARAFDNQSLVSPYSSVAKLVTC